MRTTYRSVSTACFELPRSSGCDNGRHELSGCAHRVRIRPKNSDGSARKRSGCRPGRTPEPATGGPARGRTPLGIYRVRRVSTDGRRRDRTKILVRPGRSTTGPSTAGSAAGWCRPRGVAGGDGGGGVPRPQAAGSVVRRDCSAQARQTRCGDLHPASDGAEDLPQVRLRSRRQNSETARMPSWPAQRRSGPDPEASGPAALDRRRRRAAIRAVYDHWAAGQNGPLSRRGPSFAEHRGRIPGRFHGGQRGRSTPPVTICGYVVLGPRLRTGARRRP